MGVRVGERISEGEWERERARGGSEGGREGGRREGVENGAWTILIGSWRIGLGNFFYEKDTFFVWSHEKSSNQRLLET